MKKKKDKKTVEDKINEFIDYFDEKKMCEFLRDIIPLFKLYDVDEEDDWVQKETGTDAETVQVIRLTRTAYLMSRIAQFHAGRLCAINDSFPNLWKKMEKAGLDDDDDGRDNRSDILSIG